MIPDRLQYVLDFFGTTKKVTESGPSDPVFITKIHQQYKKIMGGGILERYYFSYPRIWNSYFVGRSAYQAFWNCGIWKVANLRHLKLGSLIFWIYEFEKMEIEIWQFTLYNFGNLNMQIWNNETFQFWKLKFWQFQNLKFGKL